MDFKKMRKIEIKKLENGNGWTYAINGYWEAPNFDIGETWENMTGYKTKEVALEAGERRARFMDESAKTFKAEGDWPSDPHGYNY